jgi:hypothetical protein
VADNLNLYVSLGFSSSIIQWTFYRHRTAPEEMGMNHKKDFHIFLVGLQGGNERIGQQGEAVFFSHAIPYHKLVIAETYILHPQA